MFNKKMQTVFKNYIEMIENDKPDDFYKTIKALEQELVDNDVSVKPPQFFADFFDELENPRSSFEIDVDHLKTLYDFVPDTWKKKKFTEDIITKKVPEQRWEDFNFKMAASVNKQNKNKVLGTFLQSIRYQEPVVVCSSKIKNGYVVSAFIENVADSFHDYNGDDQQVNAILDQTLGKPEDIKKILAKKLSKRNIRMVDWPCYANLDNPHYEIEVTAAEGTVINQSLLEKRVKEIIASHIYRM